MAADRDEVLRLYDGLPAEVQELALGALRRLDTRDRTRGPFAWLVGYHYTLLQPGDVVCELDVGRAHHNPAGIAHGGAIYTLVDAAMGACAMSVLEAGRRCVTAELKVNYLKAVEAGRIAAHARVIRKGARLVVLTAEVHDAAGDLVAIGLGTFAIIESDTTPASGK